MYCISKTLFKCLSGSAGPPPPPSPPAPPPPSPSSTIQLIGAYYSGEGSDTLGKVCLFTSPSTVG